MAKILRKYTTIPPHLYIKRNADAQLKQIVEDMDRPGYVLVARQMGKTNLLLNAKRELESVDLLFVYIDLSMVFKKEREYYRNIIDTIIETNKERYPKLDDIITNRSEIDKIPPHREHFNELREILKIIRGRLVIILDEIDALRTMEYSDKVFAQIRSMYFTRTTYPEFENLTYILSGVIEPSDLIKDKNKSPFNIGEKIYLNDFTKKEHETFIERSQLNISAEISDEVYVWTNGNPRLTFDICSEIEDFININGNILKTDLAKIIHDKYLVSFDIAPIDHIRTLVRNNKIIRNAVRSINNKTNGISDEIKRKLYLYGIITSDFDSKSLKIKNPIIAMALTNEWINNVDEARINLIDQGLEKIKSKDFNGAITVFKEFLNSTIDISSFNHAVANHHIGFAYFKNKQYDDAINAFNLAKFPIDTESGKEFHYTTLSLLGQIYYLQGNRETGIEYFNQIVSNYKKGYAYRNALLNLSVHYFFIDDCKNSEVYFTELEGELKVDCPDITNSEKTRLQSYISYYLSRIYLKINNHKKALEKINDSIQCHVKDYYPVLLLQKYKIENKNELLIEAKDFIIRNQLYIAHDISDYLSFNKDILFKILILLFRIKEIKAFDELIGYSYSDKELENIQKQELLVAICRFARYEKDKVDLLEHVISHNATELQTQIIAYEELAFVKKGEFQFYEDYEKLFQELRMPMNLRFLRITLNAIQAYYSISEFSIVKKICNSIIIKLLDEKSNIQQELILMYYWLCNVCLKLRDYNFFKIYANNGIVLLTTYKIGPNSLLDTENIQIIKETFYRIKDFDGKISLSANIKHGRNEIVTVRYLDGNIICTKYKKIIQDIESNKCILIDR